MVRKEGREKDHLSLIFFGSQAKNSTKLFILTFYTLDHFQLCKLVLWIPRASFKNALEIHVVSHFFQHLVSNILIRLEAIRTKLIYPSIFDVQAFPKCWRKLTNMKSVCQRAISSLSYKVWRNTWHLTGFSCPYWIYGFKDQTVRKGDCHWL